MVKFSRILLERTGSQQLKAISGIQKRKRKQKRKEIDGTNEVNSSDNACFDKSSDDVLINILSHMSLKEAARTSVLAHRWRYLWRFVFGTLLFDYRDVMEVDKFLSWVNTVLGLHQGRYIEGMVISFEGMDEGYRIGTAISRAIDSWLCIAVQKGVERFGLHGNGYEFPCIEMLMANSRSPFCRLRTLKLADVLVKDEVVHYFVASCPDLEQLCISDCSVTKNLRVVDPPSLRVLEISNCYNIQSLEISAANLVSLAYGGGKNGLLLKKIPNLRELTMGKGFCLSFISEPKEHSSYSDKLVKLVLDTRFPTCNGPIVAPPDLPKLCSLKQLEVKVHSLIGRSVLFFTSLIKASPQLCEFRIEMCYFVTDLVLKSEEVPYPAITAAEAAKFDHKCLKVVEMSGYVGCSSEDKLLLELFKNAPLIERVVIDTQSDYYDDPMLAAYIRVRRKNNFADTFREMGATTRSESRERAKRLVSTSPQRIECIIT